MNSRIFKMDNYSCNSYATFLENVITEIEHTIYDCSLNTLADPSLALDYIEARKLPTLVAMFNDYALADEDDDAEHYVTFFRFLRRHPDLLKVFASDTGAKLDGILIDFYYANTNASSLMRDIIYECLEKACENTLATEHPTFDASFYHGLV